MSELTAFDVRRHLNQAGDAVRRRFEAQRRVLSFSEYLELVAAHPARHTRDAARYLRDMFDHFGQYEVDRPWGKTRRFALFDLPFDDGDERRRSDRLIGHEALQESVYLALESFRREGRANRLLLLHGPNGSAKSTFAACIMRALEVYSGLDEGALYRFSWVFPRGRDGKEIGFTTEADVAIPGGTYAHLPEEKIDAKLPSEIREHPLLLLPVTERRAILEELVQNGHSPPDMLWSGELGHKNQLVVEALLTAYRGDLSRVMAHVQVERYYISRRFRTGAVTIGPQMAVDARERQITADRSLGSLPASLSAVTLFESFGELVDGCGGVIEYSDLLKRPLDAWKYLLLAIESGEVSLPLSNLPINSVMLASSNELHLRAFQEHPEYHSFRGRLVLLQVPYLRDFHQERGIYDAQITSQVRRHVAPHVTHLAALWAVLTRLRRSHPERFADPELGRIAGDLTPLEKAQLYASGQIPRRLSRDEAKTLRQGIDTVYNELGATTSYEGASGASAREMRMVLLDAANDQRESCLHPLSLLDRLAAFCTRDDYEFLKLAPDRGYHDAKGFVRIAKECWLDLVDDELRACTGLVEESQYLELFDQYVAHVSHLIKKERIYSAHTGEYEDPDEEFMQRVESMIGAGDGQSFRDELMSAVAAWAIDHPDQPVVYPELFPRYIEALGDAYFRERKRQIAEIGRAALMLLSDDPDALKPDEQRSGQHTIDQMIQRFGYARESIRVALNALLTERYADL